MNEQRARFQQVASELEIASDFIMFAELLTTEQREKLAEILNGMTHKAVEREVPRVLASIPVEKLPPTPMDCTLAAVKNLVDIYYSGSHRVYMIKLLRDKLLSDFYDREDRREFAELVDRIPMAEVQRGSLIVVAHDLVQKHYSGPRVYAMNLLMRDALHALWGA